MKTVTVNKLVMAECEDCHKPIEPAENVPWGFVSPESDKMRASNVLGIAAIEVLEKVVCKKCYFKAFERVYPGEPLPKIYGGEIYAKT